MVQGPGLSSKAQTHWGLEMSWGGWCPLQGAASSSLGRIKGEEHEAPPTPALPCELAHLKPRVRGFFLGLSWPLGAPPGPKPAEAASQILPLLTGGLGQPLCASVPPSVKWARAGDVQWDYMSTELRTACPFLLSRAHSRYSVKLITEAQQWAHRSAGFSD